MAAWPLLADKPVNAQLLFFLAMTGPASNRCGLFAFSIADAADRFGIDLAVARSYLTDLCKTFDWTFDPSARVLWIRDWWALNPAFAANESALRGALRDLFGLPRTHLLRAFVEAGVPTSAVTHERFENIVDEVVGDWWRDIEATHGVGTRSPGTVPGHGVTTPSPDTVSVDRDAAQSPSPPKIQDLQTRRSKNGDPIASDRVEDQIEPAASGPAPASVPTTERENATPSPATGKRRRSIADIQDGLRRMAAGGGR